MLEKSGYKLYVKNNLINVDEISAKDRFKAIYQKKILYEKIEDFIDEQYMNQNKVGDMSVGED